ncbi:MAG: serine/threonine protein kinase [Verrucomicrobia bacterium]|nr:serine/threonine protein kinase [Verrucomicrobiota bacterium]
MTNRYKIKSKLGRGGVGAIYHAYDNTLKRDVAIKRLLPIEETHLNEATNHTLDREVDALSRLHHPNVINLFAFEEDDEGPFVVMEYIEGNTLQDIVSRGAMSLKDFIIVATQTLDPLVTAQELGLLHRDIKPDNIMLQWLSSGSFQVKVLDFGLAKFSQTPSLQTLDQTGAFMGSIDYLAPEQLDRHPLDARTDLYSLGCVLYYCLAQRSPFKGDTPAATMSNHTNHSVTHISGIRQDIPLTIAEWLMTLIARHPDQRPENANAALKMFKLAQAGEMPEIITSEAAAVSSVFQTAPAPLTATALSVSIGPPNATSLDAGISTTNYSPNYAPSSEISSPVLPPPKQPTPSMAHQTRPFHAQQATQKLITQKIITKTKRIDTQLSAQSLFHPMVAITIQSPMAWIIAILTIIILCLTGFLIEEKYPQEGSELRSFETSFDSITRPSEMNSASR